MFRAVMVLRNSGTVMAEWGFVPKNDEQTVCKSWLKFSPMEGILAPEESCEVEVLLMLNLEEAYEIATTKANVSLFYLCVVVVLSLSCERVVLCLLVNLLF